MNKYVNKRILILMAASILVAVPGLAYPAYDTEQDCRTCHGSTTTRHHALVMEGNIGCPDCHPTKYGVQEIIRNCLVCHPGMTHDNCISCHGTNYTGALPTVANTFVNISSFNESVHQNINNTPVEAVNTYDCWACHYNRDMNRENINKCSNCHRKPSSWHGNANITTNLSELFY